jgi:hypothetical protein
VRAPDTKVVDQNIWHDPARLREWTIEQLHRADLEGLPSDYPVVDRRRALQLQFIVESREVDEQIRDALRRCMRSDPNEYEAVLFRNPELKGYLRNKRGRPGGHPHELIAAWNEVKHIRALWQQAFGRKYRAKSPTAIEIAAERYNLTPLMLDDYRKNR